jgi:hypothetical protein
VRGWAHLRGEKRDDGDRFTIERDKFNLISRAALMDEDNCADVSAPQAVFRQINRQHDAI